MPVERNRTQKPAQRRPRADKACNACRTAKQRCEPIEYGKSGRPCHRCVSQDLDCSLSRETRSQSPASVYSVQGPVSGGVPGNLTSVTEPGVQYMPRQTEPPRFSVANWGTPDVQSEQPQDQDAGLLDPAKGSYVDHAVVNKSLSGVYPGLPINYIPLEPSMQGHDTDHANVIIEQHNGPQSFYYEHFYEQGPSSSTHMPSLVTRGAATNEQNLYRADELEIYNDGPLVGERSGVGPPNPREP